MRETCVRTELWYFNNYSKCNKMDNLEYIFWPTQRPHHFVSFHHLWSVLRKLWFRNVSNLYPLNARRIQIYKLFKLEPRIGFMIIIISCKQFVKYTHAKWQPVQKIIHLTRNNFSVSPENMDAIYLFQLRKLCFPSIRGPGGSIS